MNGFTQQLAAAAASAQRAAVSVPAAEVARQCLLDFIGVALAGANDPILQRIVDVCLEEGGHPAAQILGRSLRLSQTQAALINGSAAHVLDYDDVNMTWPGHPSVVIWPAVLAISETSGADGAAALTAFVAGYEVASRLGATLSPGHYGAGFHPTATLGCFAAAAAAGRLLNLTDHQMAHALAIAGTQGAGLTSAFGTMCKPLQAGRAAANGVMAALLAARGFEGRRDLLECKQGFAETHSRNFLPPPDADAPITGLSTQRTLFKHHAACYLTHAVLEAARTIAAKPDFNVGRVCRIQIVTHTMARTVCHIERPASGLEAKFSLTVAAALALLQEDTGRLDLFCDDIADRPDLVVLRDKVQVRFIDDGSPNWAHVSVTMSGGATFEAEADTGEPSVDLVGQRSRLLAKFGRLAAPVVGVERAAAIADDINRFDQLSIAQLQSFMRSLSP